MKKIILLISIVLLPFMLGAQAQINTKKVKIGDFTEKITKVVLEGEGFYDTVLRDEITARWRISPYEFCTMEEFEALMGDDRYYFLLTVSGQFKKESAPGLQFLTLIKGGEGAEKGIDGLLELVSLPFASVEYPSGRELIFLPALLDIIQNHTLSSIASDFSGYGGLGSKNISNISKSKELNLVFSEDDISEGLTEADIEKYFDDKMVLIDEEGADQHMLDGSAETLVSFVVAPTEPHPGSFCYKMMIDAQTHKLYYFAKHRISEKLGPGFLKKDLIAVTALRKH